MDDIEHLLKQPGSTMPGAAPKPSTTPNPAVPPARKTMSFRPGAMLLSVQVPAEAKVLINGRPTQSTGTLRQYVSYGLQQGKLYPYEVTVILPRAEASQVTKVVYVKAGEDRRLAFRDDLRLESQLAIAAGAP